MSAIDQRIVQMKFDNNQFESGIRTSLSSLDKLKNALNLNSATQGLDKLKNSTKGFTVANITDGVDSLSLKFNAFGIAASTVISNITTALQNKLASGIRNTIGLISSGGMRRAQNLEQARFSMQGLLEQTEKLADGTEKKLYKYGITVEDVMGADGPVQRSVRGTAYGLDESAKAASNFIASGITDMDDLGDALSSIAGTAAQTGGSFEEIAHIYQRVAGQGRVYATDLNSIASRGVNAAMAITDYVNSLNGNFEGTSEKFQEFAADIGKTTDFTEQDIRDMVSDGAIQFDMFAKAMYAAFGENAYRANETFSGSLSNMKAALSRLGAKFKSPYLENMRDIFNALRPLIDSVSKAIDPLINKYNALYKVVNDFAVEKIGKVQKYFDDLFNSSKYSSFEIEEKFAELSKGLSKVEQIELRKKLESEAIGPIGRLINSFDNLVSAMKNIGGGLSNIFSPLINDIRKFIGYTTPVTLIIENLSKKIKDFSEAFKNYTSGDRFEATYLQVFKDALWAVMNVINIGKEIVINFASSISKLLKPALSTFLALVTYIIDPISDLITNFSEIIRENNLVYLSFKRLSDILEGVLGPVLDWIWKTFMTDNGSPVSLLRLYDVVDYLSNGFANLADKASDFLSTDKDFRHLGESIVSVFEGIGKFLSPAVGKLGEAATSIKSLFSSIGGSETSIMDKATNALTSFANAIGKVVKVLSDNLSLGDILKVGIFARLVTGVGALKMLWVEINNLYTMLKGAMDRISMMKLGTLKSIATSILMLAAALFILSLVDTVKLAGATAAMHILMEELKAFYTSMSVLASSKTVNAAKLISLSAAMVPLSIALLLLSSAVKKLSEISWEGLLKGITSIGILISYLTLYSKQVSGLDTSKGTTSLIALAIAVKLLVSAVEKLGELDVGSLAKGLTSVAVLLTSLGLFTKFSNVSGVSLSSGIAMIALAAAINILAKAVYAFGVIDTNQLAKGLVAIGVVLVEIGVFAKLINGAKILSASASVLIISASLLVLSKALEALSALSIDQLKTSLISMAASLGIIAIAMNLMPANALMTSVAIIGMATGIVILAGALTTLSQLSLGQIAIGLVAIIGAFAVIGGAAILLGPLTPIILALSVAMGIFGAGLLAVAAAVTMLSATLTVFTAGVAVSAEMIVEALIAILPALMQGVIDLFPKFMEMLTMILDTTLTFIVTNVPKLVEAALQFVTGILEGIAEYVPRIVDAGMKILIGLLKGIADNIQQIVEEGANIVINFINGISNKLPEIIDAGVELILSFIQGITQAINEHSYEIGEAAWDLAEALVNGMIDGIAGFISKPVEKIKELGQGVLDGLKDILGINSPSKETEEIARNTVTGFENGLSRNEGGAFSKVKKFASGILKNIQDKLGKKNSTQYGKDAVSGISTGMQSAEASVRTTTDRIVKSVLDRLKSGLAASRTKPFGADLMNGISTGISSQQNTVISKITSVINAIKSKLTSLLSSGNFKSFGSNITNGIVQGINANTITNKVSSVASTIKNKFASAFSSRNFNAYGKNITSGIASGMNSSTVTSTASTVASKTKSSISSYLSYWKMYDIGSDVMSGLKAGMNSKSYNLYSRAAEIASNIADTLKKALKINSPSKVTMEIGESIIEGLDDGMGKDDTLLGNAKKLAKSLTNKIASNINSDNVFAITPVLDLSEIQNGVSNMNSMFNNSSLSGISANVNGSINSISVMSAFDKLSSLIGGMPNQMVNPDEIYNAVREGASNAVINVLLDGERITSNVNSRNNDALNTMLSFYGG